MSYAILRPQSLVCVAHGVGWVGLSYFVSLAPRPSWEASL
jgi:hypothetical protein